MTKQSNTANDICSSIRSSDSIDPFEGLNLDDICVSPAKLNPSQTPGDDNSSGNKLFTLNPLDSPNLKNVCVPPEKISSSHGADDHQQFIQALRESDLKSTIVLPGGEPVTEKVVLPGDEPVTEKEIDEDTFLSNDIAHPPLKLPRHPVHPVIEKAYHYAELTQIRQKIFASLKETDGKTILIASPLDNTGSSLLAAALAYNIACSCQQSVLLIDCNMRRAGLHDFFVVPQSYGFTDLILNNLPWQAVVKQTSTSNLSIITAGESVEHFSEHLQYAHIPNLVRDIQNQYDLIIFDTSPVLKPNRNNVNIAALTAVADYFLLVTKQKGTTKDQLKETNAIIEAGNGKIHGIVMNEYSPSPKPTPYKQ